ncbi:MAG: hypothetical protein NVSMB64_19340 [Candidatus Velthaea sp.]
MESEIVPGRLRGDTAGLLALGENQPENASAIEEIRRLFAPRVRSDGPLLRAVTLGTFRVFGACVETTLPAPKRGREVIAYLVAFPGRTVTRRLLGEAFWPELDADAVAHRLHIAVSGARAFLREVLDGFDAIRCTGSGYAWHPELRVQTDVAQFTDLHREGTPQAMKAAVGLYGGEFLAGERGDWIEPMRVRCASMYASMLEKLAAAALSYGEHERALGYGLDLLTVDRANETASRIVMKCFAALGRRGRALAEYESLRLYLHKHLGLEPAPETQSVMRGIAGVPSVASIRERTS